MKLHALPLDDWKQGVLLSAKANYRHVVTFTEPDPRSGIIAAHWHCGNPYIAPTLGLYFTKDLEGKSGEGLAGKGWWHE